MKFAVVVSRFNKEVTLGLKDGALKFLRSQPGLSQGDIEVVEVPGAFEIPLAAQRLAKTGLYKGIICLGCVIKGETAHFEWISHAASSGLMQVMLLTSVPIGFGVLTAYTEEQALARSQDNEHNKGIEAAAACWEMAQREPK